MLILYTPPHQHEPKIEYHLYTVLTNYYVELVKIESSRIHLV